MNRRRYGIPSNDESRGPVSVTRTTGVGAARMAILSGCQFGKLATSIMARANPVTSIAGKEDECQVR